MLATIAPAPVKHNNIKSVLGMNSVNIQQQNIQSLQQEQHQQLNQNSGYNKKKFTYSNMPFGQQPVSVVRRNARERNRVKQVNNGFVTLRQHIPQNVIQALSNGGRGPHKKLSKVDTLRLAVEYIRRLQDIVTDQDDITKPSSLSSLSSSTSLSDFSNSEFDHMLASPNSETSSYYTDSPEPVLSNQQHHIYSNSQQQQQQQQLLIHNTSVESQNNQSEASISPAPSYISETSSLSPNSMPNYGNSGSNSYGLNSTTTTIIPNSSTTTLTPVITSTGLNYSVNQFKFEPYDDYSSIHQNHNQHHHNIHNHHSQHQHHSNNTIIVETATTSEDEELLDYISMWQEEQQ